MNDLRARRAIYHQAAAPFIEAARHLLDEPAGVATLSCRPMSIPAPTVGELDPSVRLLLGPGPSPVHPRVYRAMTTPLARPPRSPSSWGS